VDIPAIGKAAAAEIPANGKRNRSHTDGCGTLGGGAFYAMSSKQKLNTRSSTKAELVGVDDMMGKILWTQLFLKAQGYDVGPAQLDHDNMSAMLLEKNGTWSSTKRTRHLDNGYFFVTDWISKGDVMVEYCQENHNDSAYWRFQRGRTIIHENKISLNNQQLSVFRQIRGHWRCTHDGSIVLYRKNQTRWMEPIANLKVVSVYPTVFTVHRHWHCIWHLPAADAFFRP
jgi:hypothetical protein